MRRFDSSLDTTAYLDGWMIIADSWDSAQRAWDHVREYCSLIGTQINMRKTWRVLAFPRGRRQRVAPRGDFVAFDMVGLARYEGVEAPGHLAHGRVVNSVKRVIFARYCHFPQ